MEIRYYGDKLSERIAKTPEGFLICQDVPISRTGYQEYLAKELMDDPINGDKIIPVYRPAKEVFDIRSLASFEGKPVTNEHPEEDVTPANYQQYSCGHVQNVHVGDGEDSNKVLADLYITDPTLIHLIENGKREISCGYYAEEKRDSSGRLYQTKIRGNHVAVVKSGRAGNKVCIRDSKTRDVNKTRKPALSDYIDGLEFIDLNGNYSESSHNYRTMDSFYGDENMRNKRNLKRFRNYLDDDIIESEEIVDDDELLDDDDVMLDDDELLDEDTILEDEDELMNDDELLDDDEVLEDDDEELMDACHDDEELLDDDDVLEDDDELLSDEDEIMEGAKQVIADAKFAMKQIKRQLKDHKACSKSKKASVKNRKARKNYFDSEILSDDDLMEDDEELLDEDLPIEDDDELLDACRYEDLDELLNDDELLEEEVVEDDDELLDDDELSDDDEVLEDNDEEIMDEDALEDDDELLDNDELLDACHDDDEELMDEDVIEDDDELTDDDELMDDDVEIEESEEVTDDNPEAEVIDTDKSAALREITEASRGISDPNERKNIQDAIYNALCGKRNQMADVMRITKKARKARMDAAFDSNSKVSLDKQQSIYDSFNPHKKTSF